MSAADCANQRQVTHLALPGGMVACGSTTAARTSVAASGDGVHALEGLLANVTCPACRTEIKREWKVKRMSQPQRKCEDCGAVWILDQGQCPRCGSSVWTWDQPKVTSGQRIQEFTDKQLALHEARICLLHGERIAKALEEVAEGVRNGLYGREFAHADAAADAVLECARLTRALSRPETGG